MLNCRNFTLATKNNLFLPEYVEKISLAFGEEALLDKHIYTCSKLEDGYNYLILNHKIFKENFYLDIDFILGGSREYLKLNCNIFAEGDEEIDKTRNKLEEICGIKNVN